MTLICIVLTPVRFTLTAAAAANCRCCCCCYRCQQGFVEIHSPKLLAGASEGGSEVFMTDYFGQTACLAQSPQLYKQMTAACGGFGRVMEVRHTQETCLELVYQTQIPHTKLHSVFLCKFGPSKPLDSLAFANETSFVAVNPANSSWAFAGVHARCQPSGERFILLRGLAWPSLRRSLFTGRVLFISAYSPCPSHARVTRNTSRLCVCFFFCQPKVEQPSLIGSISPLCASFFCFPHFTHNDFFTSWWDGVGSHWQVGPVFRAEKSRTHRHLCEFTGLDFEMVIKEHYYEVRGTVVCLMRT